jgi:hypothetical protein
MDRDDCIRALSALQKGDVVAVGKSRWQVERNIGVTNYVVKHGTKGRKLYRLWPVEPVDRCCLEVREVFPGSGDLMPDKKPAAKGCAVDDRTWRGRRRRRKR